jgi:hypothetical protein
MNPRFRTASDQHYTNGPRFSFYRSFWQESNVCIIKQAVLLAERSPKNQANIKQLRNLQKNDDLARTKKGITETPAYSRKSFCRNLNKLHHRPPDNQKKIHQLPDGSGSSDKGPSLIRHKGDYGRNNS